MASFFGSNPFSTPVGQRIEQATQPDQASENWALNMEICDIINETDEGPKDSVKAIRKKLTMNAGKNYTVVMYTLTVLETCVKNCGKRFHLQVASKEFLSDMIKIIGPKYDPPTVVQEKILSMIQTWADAFRGNPDLKEVERCYQDLKSKGIEFPMTDLDSLAPIHTPARGTPEVDPAMLPQGQQQRISSSRANPYVVPPQPVMGQLPQQPQMPPPQPVAVVSGPVNPTPEQLAKLRSELDVVLGNARVFGEMLTEMTPGQENHEDLDLLQELNRTCRAMQQRIQELLQQVANGEVLEELLRVNDDLNNAFVRYDRFERYRMQSSPQTEAAPPPPYPVTAPTSQPVPSIPPPAPRPNANTATANLIDLALEPAAPPTMLQQPPADPFSTSNIQPQLAGMNLGSNPTGQLEQSDDFDMFAQSRQSFDQNIEQVQPGSTYANQQVDQYGGGLGAAVNAKTTPYGDNMASNEDEPQLLDKDKEFDEMEQWLSKNKEIPGTQTTASSSEFDKFLSDRAALADTLPDLPAVPCSDPASTEDRSGGTNVSRSRQMKKDDQENALFAL